MNLISIGLALALGLVIGIWLGGSKEDPLTRFEKCLEKQSCVVTRYEYTPYQGTPNIQERSTCSMYRLPILQTMPLIGEISNEINRQPSKAEDILLGFIERALQTNVQNTTALEKSYDEYLRGCGIDPDATLPLTTPNDGSKKTPVAMPNVSKDIQDLEASSVNDEDMWMYPADYKAPTSNRTE